MELSGHHCTAFLWGQPDSLSTHPRGGYTPLQEGPPGLSFPWLTPALRHPGLLSVPQPLGLFHENAFLPSLSLVPTHLPLQSFALRSPQQDLPGPIYRKPPPHGHPAPSAVPCPSMLAPCSAASPCLHLPTQLPSQPRSSRWLTDGTGP